MNANWLNRGDILKQVKDLKRTSRRVTKAEFEKMLQHSIDRLGKGTEDLKQELQSLHHQNKLGQRFARQEQKVRKKALSQLANKQARDLDALVAEMKDNTVDKDTRKQAQMAIKAIHKNTKVVKKGIGRV